MSFPPSFGGVSGVFGGQFPWQTGGGYSPSTPPTHQRRAQQLNTQQLHTQQRHTTSNKPAIACAACGRPFESESALEGHIGAEHLGWRPLVCANCPADFVNHTQLRDHYAAWHPSKMLASKTRYDAAKETEMKTLMDRSLGRLTAAAQYSQSRAFGSVTPMTPVISAKKTQPTSVNPTKTRPTNDVKPPTEIKCEVATSAAVFPTPVRKRQATSPPPARTPECQTKKLPRAQCTPSTGGPTLPQSSDKTQLLRCQLCDWTSGRGGDYIRVHVFSHIAKQTGRKRFSCGAPSCAFGSNKSPAVQQHRHRYHKADGGDVVDNSSELQTLFDDCVKRCFGGQLDGATQTEDDTGPATGSGSNRATCELCKVSIARSTTSAHVNRFHLNRPFYFCSQCSFESRNPDHVKDHLKKEHDSNEAPMNRQNDEEVVKERAEWYKKCFPKIDFDSARAHTGQEVKAFGSKCNLCGPQVSAKEREKHVRARHLQIELFKCPLCDFAHASKRAAVQHHIERVHGNPEDVSVIDLKDCYKQQIASLYRDCFEIRQSEDESGGDGKTPTETAAAEPKRQPLPSAQSNTCLLCGIEVTRNDHAVHLLHCQMDVQRFQCLQCKFAHDTDPLLVRKHMTEAHKLPERLPHDLLQDKFEELKEMLCDAFPSAVNQMKDTATPVHYSTSGPAFTQTCNLCSLTTEKRQNHVEKYHLKTPLTRCALCSYTCFGHGTSDCRRDIKRHVANCHRQTDLSNGISLAGCFTNRMQRLHARCFEKIDDGAKQCELKGKDEAVDRDTALTVEMRRPKLSVEKQTRCPLCSVEILPYSHHAHFLRDHLQLSRFKCRQCEFNSDADPMAVFNHMQKSHQMDEESAPLDMLFERATEIGQLINDAFYPTTEKLPKLRHTVAKVRAHDAVMAWYELTVGDKFILRALELLCNLITATCEILIDPTTQKISQIAVD